MAERKDMHGFAVKYYHLCVNPQTTAREIEKQFTGQCFALGVEMDCGKRFTEIFSDGAFYINEELDKIINCIDDTSLLGSAIFSSWKRDKYAYNKNTSNNASWGAVKRLDHYDMGVVCTL